ncbi:MAG: carboxymuconolactone decarboxylase family protein [Gemmatimonadota bacterium]|jgi:alkylhydroperoxidase/carboxymuconolactone decarboxylase family protein YurZ
MIDEEKGLTIQSDSDLPRTYERFSDRFPAVVSAHTAMGMALDDAGPLDRKIAELVKIGVCVGASLESATKSHVRRAVYYGATREEVEHAVIQGMNTVGFSRTVMAWVWATEQMNRE